MAGSAVCTDSVAGWLMTSGDVDGGNSGTGAGNKVPTRASYPDGVAGCFSTGANFTVITRRSTEYFYSTSMICCV